MKKVNGVEKYMLSEVVEFRQERNRSIVDFGDTFRHCTYCGMYTNVENCSGEAEISVLGQEEKTFFDICDPCQDKIRQGKIAEIEYIDADDVEICHGCENLEDECEC